MTIIDPLLNPDLATGLRSGFDTYLYVEPPRVPHGTTPGATAPRESGQTLVVWVEDPAQAFSDADDTGNVPVRMHKEYHDVPADNPVLRLPDSALIPLAPARDVAPVALTVGKSSSTETAVGYLVDGVLRTAPFADSPVTHADVTTLERTTLLQALTSPEVRWAADLSPLRAPLSRVTGLQARITALEGTVAWLRLQVESAVERHRQDIAHIGSVFWDEADRRDWCSEADQVIRGMNRGLHEEILLRERTFLVDFTLSGEATVTTLSRGLQRDVEVTWSVGYAERIATSDDPDDVDFTERISVPDALQDVDPDSVEFSIDDDEVEVSSVRDLWQAIREEVDPDSVDVSEESYDEE